MEPQPKLLFPKQLQKIQERHIQPRPFIAFRANVFPHARPVLRICRNDGFIKPQAFIAQIEQAQAKRKQDERNCKPQGTL
jgi:hypothetical protein